MGAGVVWSFASLVARDMAVLFFEDELDRPDMFKKSVARKYVDGDAENRPQP
jgi:hypothetical protein